MDITARLQRFMNLLSIDDLIVIEHGPNQRLTGFEADGNGKSDDDGECGLLDGEPEGGGFHQSKNASGEDADEAENGENIPFAAGDEIIDSVAERKHEGNDETPDGAQDMILAELRQENPWQDRVAGEVEPQVLSFLG